MEKMTNYLVLSICMAAGAYLPVLLGADGFGGWSILTSSISGFIAVYIIYRLN